VDPALAKLLDDPSPTVRTALLAYLGARGTQAEDFLRGLARSGTGPVALAAAQYLKELNFSDPAEEFRVFIRSLNYELETGMLLLARTVNPQLDAGICHSALDAMADRCRELITEPSGPREKCRVINRVLFHEWGLRGDVEHYTDPRNSFLDQVLLRRKGIPLTLTVIYLLAADRLGMTLHPVALPGFFLVAGESDAVPFYIDPFEQGTLRSETEVIQLLRARQYFPQAGDLSPSPVREVLARCCRNLVNHFREAGDLDKAKLFAGFIEEFDLAYARNQI
jgi:regulator of sirC expression with transglutaminase-like and TPR domain